MKINKFNYVIAILAAVAVIAVWQTRTEARAGSKSIELSLKTEKQIFTLGEVIGFDFEVKNVSGTIVEIDSPNVHKGNLRVFVSADGANYSEYVGPSWGIVDIPRHGEKLDHGEVLKTKATMFFNHRIRTEHLSELYAEKFRKQRLSSDFAVMDAGTYWIKAVYSEDKVKFESEPLPIEITQPAGLDLAVWERIKTNGAYAYFLQTGDVKYYPKSREAVEFIQSLRDISADYPSSILSEKITDNLTKIDQIQESIRRLKSER